MDRSIKLQIPSTNLPTISKIGNWKLEIGNSTRQGYTLLFAILVMGMVSISTVSLASIVLRSLRVARDLDDATVALYAAEAGNEEALYRVGQSLSPCIDMASGDVMVLSNTAIYKRVCTIDAAKILIRSTGSFGNARMALQVKIPL